MIDEERLAELRERITRTENLIAECEARMAAHSPKFDNPKKGTTCRNYIARHQHKKERDRYERELVELKSRLDREVGSAGTASPPPDPAAQHKPMWYSVAWFEKDGERYVGEVRMMDVSQDEVGLVLEMQLGEEDYVQAFRPF